MPCRYKNYPSISPRSREHSFRVSLYCCVYLFKEIHHMCLYSLSVFSFSDCIYRDHPITRINSQTMELLGLEGLVQND